MKKLVSVVLVLALCLWLCASAEGGEIRIQVTSEPKTICTSDDPLYNYFAWPSVVQTRDGKLAMACSGFRIQHIDPFGTGVICFSDDGGQTWTEPVTALETPLDDRDCGLCAFGEDGLLITSFNNSIQMQRNNLNGTTEVQKMVLEYLRQLKEEKAERKYYGSTFAISHDNGTTFGEVQFAPVTSPHGPTELPDGSLLFVGRWFGGKARGKETQLAALRWTEDGGFEELGVIPDAEPGNKTYSCHEPHAIMLKSGKIVVHIRLEGGGALTTYQSVSTDGGATFSEPVPLMDMNGGAPAHLLECADGTLISVYGYRQQPYGVRMMYSLDEGETWSTGHVVTDGYPSPDLGYPCSVQLESGEILTVFYARDDASGPASIKQVIWTYSFDEAEE